MKIVAEIGLQHCGCLGTALSFIDAVAAAGADACKFQHHGGDKCNKFRPGTFFPQDQDRQAYYKRTMFDAGGWQALYNRAKLRGIEFGCSVWSADTVAWLNPFVDFWKVPSGEVVNTKLLEAMANTEKQVVLSSGMSTASEVSLAQDISGGMILQCTSAYPCPPELIGMNLLEEGMGRAFMRRYPDGLSDHSGTIWPGVIAAHLTAQMLEVHVCWDKRQFGPDVPASLEIDELAMLARAAKQLDDKYTIWPSIIAAWENAEMPVIPRMLRDGEGALLEAGIKFVRTMRANPVDKDALAASEEIQAMRQIFATKD